MTASRESDSESQSWGSVIPSSFAGYQRQPNQPHFSIAVMVSGLIITVRPLPTCSASIIA